MSYYNEPDDFYYNEPGEFEEKMDELKESLMGSVKKDYIDEMNRLKKENAELQEIKKNMKNLESEHKDKLYQLDRERRDLEYKIKKERISSLIGEVEYFTVASTGKQKPKCEKCNENRKLEYKTPKGRVAYETCDCAEKIPVFEPIPTLLVELSIREGKGNAWYKVKERDSRSEYLLYYEDSIHGSKLITDEKQFEDIDYPYGKMFQTKELAQKYCDLKNKELEEKQ